MIYARQHNLSLTFWCCALQALLTAKWPSELQYHQKSCIRQLLHVAEEEGAAAAAAATAAAEIPAMKGESKANCRTLQIAVEML